MKPFYYRNLPHIQPLSGFFFVTFRLADSLPISVILNLQKENETKLQAIEKHVHVEQRTTELYKQQKRYFAVFDRCLDRNPYGSCWLGQAEIANVVTEALHFRDGKEYQLITYCIMPNHVHLVVGLEEDENQSDASKKQLYGILQSLKRSTARTCNIQLQRTGAFWQKESYDHLIRTPKELQNIIAYTLQNPVKAGLVQEWQQWPFSYVNEAYR